MFSEQVIRNSLWTTTVNSYSQTAKIHIWNNVRNENKTQKFRSFL